MSLVVIDLPSCGWPMVGTDFSEWAQIFQKNSLEPILGGSKLNVTKPWLALPGLGISLLFDTNEHGVLNTCSVELLGGVPAMNNLILAKWHIALSINIGVLENH